MILELAQRVLRNEILDDFAVFGIIGQTGQLSLSDKAVAGQMTVTV